MMRFFVATAVLAGLCAVGCADQPAKKSKIVEVAGTDPSATKRPSASSSSSSSGADTADEALTEEETEETPSEEPPPGDPNDPKDPTEPPPDPMTPKKATCTSQNGGHKSITDITYVNDGGSLTFTSLTVTITNSDHRNENDIDLYVTPPGGSEDKAFNSGDVLPDGKTTTVKVPSNLSVKVGSRVRISTNFDERFTDPHASCNIQL